MPLFSVASEKLEHVGGTVFLVRVERFDKGGFAEKEADPTQVIEFGAELVVGEDREICRDQIQIGSRLQVLTEKVANTAAGVIVPDSGGWAGGGHQDVCSKQDIERIRSVQVRVGSPGSLAWAVGAGASRDFFR